MAKNNADNETLIEDVATDAEAENAAVENEQPQTEQPVVEEAPLIRADNGRAYRMGADGKLVEVYIPEDHARRLLNAINEHSFVNGFRMVQEGQPDEPATVFTFDKLESDALLAAVKVILNDRIENATK